MIERLPFGRGADAQQQNLHGAFTANAEAPEEVVRATGVVGDGLRLAGRDDLERVVTQIRLETSAGEQARVTAIRRDGHERARLAVRRPDRVYHDGERKGSP